LSASETDHSGSLWVRTAPRRSPVPRFEGYAALAGSAMRIPQQRGGVAQAAGINCF